MHFTNGISDHLIRKAVNALSCVKCLTETMCYTSGSQTEQIQLFLSLVSLILVQVSETKVNQ